MNLPLTGGHSPLVQSDRVHGSLYTDPAIFELELERIFYRQWVYVGHESEVPNPGDFHQKHIGRQPLIMARGRDGVLRVFLNRCPHRANQVCETERGNKAVFRCAYHGWTFTNAGDLVAFPQAAGYEGCSSKDDFRLARLPRVASYRGFVFGSFAAEGPTLADHLGAAAETLDRLADLSPEGELDLSTGWVKHRTKANWKMIMENETDGYHAPFVHRSIFSAAEGRIADIYAEQSSSLARDLGNGHTELDPRPELRRLDRPLYWFGSTIEQLSRYAASMEVAYGAERARQILVDGAPHVMIFPNLFIAEVSIFVIQPLEVDLTIQHVTAVQFKGAPEMNRRLLSQCIASVGPAGMLLADDSAMYERNSAGVRARLPEWCVLTRGLARETIDVAGHRVSNVTDETPQRAMWAHYGRVMTAESELVGT